MPTHEVARITAETNGSWRFEITDFPAVRSALGDEVLVAFCCCFAHGDRLTALTDFAAMSGKRHGESSAAHTRNLHAMFWLVAGTLRELALAVRYLRSELAKRQMLANLGEAWVRVQRIEAWEDDAQRRDLRNKLGFHVDMEAIRKGLARMSDNGEPVLVAAGDGREIYRTYLPLGLDAAFRGLELPEAELEGLVSSTAEHQLVPKDLQEVFMTVMQRCGVTVGQRQAV